MLETAGGLDLVLDPLDGSLAGTALGSIATANTYNDFGELESESYTYNDNPIYEVSYVRDALGRIESRTELVDGETTMYEYGYDVAGRLTDVYVNGDDEPISHYDYDLNGNRLGFGDYRGETPVVTNGEYDEQDRMTQYGIDGAYTTFTYTANGELESKTQVGVEADAGPSDLVTTYDYDVLGNLRGVDLPDGTEIDYVIDGENRRVGKVVDGILEQGFLYKDALKPIAELDGSNNVVSRFVYGSKYNVPDYMVKNGVTYRIVSNHLGSPVLVVDIATGEVAQKLTYDEFGRVLEDTNPGFQPFGFAGGLYDPDTGLVRFGARDYDAETGRWTGKDPIGFKGLDTNLYGYVMSDPINFIDPNGTLSEEEWVFLCKLAEAAESTGLCDPPDIDQDEYRDVFNDCPPIEPRDDVCNQSDNRRWWKTDDKTRGSDGSECYYRNGYLSGQGTFNYAPDETSLEHLCLDVLPWCSFHR